MPTTVGTETDTETLLRNLMYLEQDAIAAYDTTIERLDTASFRAKIETFREDHSQHVAALRDHAASHGVELPESGDMKQMLTTGKVALADLGGDGAILKAMKTNEDDTVQAYEQAVNNELTQGEMRATFEKALADERRHRDWMDAQAS